MDVHQSARHNFLNNACGIANHNLRDDKNPVWQNSIETWSYPKQDSRDPVPDAQATLRTLKKILRNFKGIRSLANQTTPRAT